MSIIDCTLRELPKILDPRGNLSFIESDKHIPFEIKRVYYLYHLSVGAERGGHGHKKLQQLILPLSGSFRVVLDDGINKSDILLDKPWVGLYICPMIWRELKDFSDNAVCLVLASDFYTEDDYYRNYDDFITAVRGDVSK